MLCQPLTVSLKQNRSGKEFKIELILGEFDLQCELFFKKLKQLILSIFCKVCIWLGSVFLDAISN